METATRKLIAITYPKTCITTIKMDTELANAVSIEGAKSGRNTGEIYEDLLKEALAARASKS